MMIDKKPYISPLGMWKTNLIACVLVIVTCMAVMTLEEGRLKYIYGIINERGPIQHLTLFWIFRLTISYIVARFIVGVRPFFLRQFKVNAFFPLLFGILGSALGLGSAVSGYAEFLAGAAELSQIKEAYGNIAIGFGVAFDTTLLGVLGTIICFGLYSKLLAFEARVNERSDILDDKAE